VLVDSMQMIGTGITNKILRNILVEFLFFQRAYSFSTFLYWLVIRISFYSKSRRDDIMNNRRCSAAQPPVIHHAAASAAILLSQNNLLSQNKNSTEILLSF
jgi:uncharacterized membrane-anchored protein